MQYSWPWCACTWSALAIKLGYTDIMPIEISCYYLIERAKAMGIWIEQDNRVPKIGEAVLYDWSDGTDYATTDNTGTPDHVGVIVEVHESAGYFVVVEGNYSNAVKNVLSPSTADISVALSVPSMMLMEIQNRFRHQERALRR